MASSTHTFNRPFSGPTRVSRYQKGKSNLDFTEATDSEWQWHQLGHRQVCTSLQTDNHASTLPLSLLQAGCPSCRPTNSIKALKAKAMKANVASDNKNHEYNDLPSKVAVFVVVRACNSTKHSRLCSLAPASNSLRS